MWSRQNVTYLLILGLCTGSAFFYGLGAYALADNNEGLYAEISREMFSSHQYIIATLNGVPYLEKPPLLYWLVTLCFHLWGVSEFAARFAPAACGALVCLSLVYFAKQFNRLYEGMVAALILSTSLGFVFISRILFFDMLLTATFSLSLMSFYLAWFFYNENQLNKTKWYVCAGYFFLGLAILTKSLMALVLIPLIGMLFLLFTRTFKKSYKYFLDPIALIIFLLTIIPWHIMAIVQHPGFLQDFFVNEQFMRFLDKRIPNDYYHGPIYYYLPWVFVYLLPWGILLPMLGFKKYREKCFKDPLKVFLWLWFLVPLIFFSLSKAKAHYYMVIVCPALALLLAQAIVGDFLKQRLVKLWTIVLVVFSLSSLTTIAIGSQLAQKYEAKFSLKPVALALKAKDPHLSEKNVFFFQNYERISSLRFYLDKPATMVDSRSKDLWYGSKFVKNLFLTDEEFVQATKNNTFYIVVREKELPKFYRRFPGKVFHVKEIFSKWVILSE